MEKKPKKYKLFAPKLDLDFFNNSPKEEEPKDKIVEDEDPSKYVIFDENLGGDLESIIIKFKKLQKIDEDFSVYESISKLGSGASGEVWKVMHKVTKKLYAQKRLVLDKNDMKPRVIVAELISFCNTQCENIIKLENFFYHEGQIYMILEYMNCGSIENVLKIVKTFPEDIISKICFEVLKSLSYLHDVRGIVHRDIKPGNLLLNDKGQVKLADFGMAGVNKKVFDTFLGTMIYMSPERIRGESHSFNSDVWSVGLMSVEMAIGRFPIPISENNPFGLLSVLSKTIEGKKILNVNPNSNFSKEFVDFVDECLKMDKDTRPSATQLLKHPFLSKYANHKPSFRSWLHKNYIKLRKEDLKNKKDKKDDKEDKKEIKKDVKKEDKEVFEDFNDKDD